MKQYPAALEHYQQARELAESIADQTAVETIEFCINDLNKKLEEGAADSSRTSSASGHSEAEKRSARSQSEDEEPTRPDEIDSKAKSTPVVAADETKSSSTTAIAAKKGP